jgi:hypothetical protein
MPEKSEDQARSIYLSDHVLSPADLEKASEVLSRGDSFVYDETMIETLANATPMFRDRYILGVRTTSWIALGIAIVVGLLFGACLVALFSLFGV